eukprot:gnl/Hemi2/5546_TR1906_c0_g1_i1.p1 gnl/Hemi2/5546_TR1906_c0_g1~~gnl/Hemi2/5546_TR1906_c0_g1_i1.p1  ORF type:complete len:299 (-),score=145.98 gnl/Hemi2/5546_TR1906_c0_g1_i1:150-935(-)
MVDAVPGFDLLPDDQKDEVEALVAIYMQDFIVIEPPPRFTFHVHLFPEADGSEQHVGAQMNVTLPSDYPASLPQVCLHPLKAMTKEEVGHIQTQINTMAPDYLGQPMIFSLAQAIKDYLLAINEKRFSTKAQMERTRMLEEQARTERVAEEMAGHSVSGTPVTLESFAAWKQVFDAEMAVVRAEKLAAEALRKGKPSGRQLFERDATLITSDAAMWEDPSDVEVDLLGGKAAADAAASIDSSLFTGDDDDDDEEQQAALFE